MNKGCYYTAQGQFACNVEKAATKKEGFFIENFDGGPQTKVDPATFNRGYKGAYSDFRKSCRMKDLNEKIKGCSVQCNAAMSDGKQECTMSCACAYNDTVDVNSDDYCMKKTDPNKPSGKGNCKPGSAVTFKMRMDGKNYTPLSTLVNYNGQLSTLDTVQAKYGMNPPAKKKPSEN